MMNNSRAYIYPSLNEYGMAQGIEGETPAGQIKY